MAGYSSAIEEIKSRCNIVDVIGSALPLTRRGNTYKACCPFHNEKTPSFVVNEDKQFYHCFGCGASGDVFSFVQNFYHVNFIDAAERLAAQYGVVIEKEEGYSSKRREELLAVNKLAARYFYSQLSVKNNEGFQYLSQRKLTPETVKTFGLGYTGDPEKYSGLAEYLSKSGIDLKLAEELGLVTRSEKNGKYYDKYRSRLMFPIIDTKGKVIGFGGRIIGDGEPKYLNSSESEIFKKKNNLFGLNNSKSAIQTEGFAYLVEGYMDMVSLYQNGVCNVVASLGTALTENQAKLLNRYCKDVVLCYDADKAGIKAALKGIDILRAAGMKVRVLHVDDGKDPDEYVKKHGKEGFLNLTKEKALGDMDYIATLIAKKYDVRDRNESILFFKALAGELRKLPPVEREVYAKDYSKKYGISEDSLLAEINRTEKAAPAAVKSEEAAPKTEDISSADIKLERLIIKLSIINPEYFTAFSEYTDSFISNNGINIARILSAVYKEKTDIYKDDLKDLLDEPEWNYLCDILENTITGNDKDAYKDCIAKLQKKSETRKLKEIEQTIQMLEDMPQDGERDSELSKMMRKLADLRKVN